MESLFNTKIAKGLAPISLNSAAATAIAIDAAGYSALRVFAGFGVIGGDATVFKLQECETTGGTYTDITGADFTVSPLAVPATATDAGKQFIIDVKLGGSRKRFFKLQITTGATTLVCSYAILARADHQSLVATDLGAALTTAYAKV